MKSKLAKLVLIPLIGLAIVGAGILRASPVLAADSAVDCNNDKISKSVREAAGCNIGSSGTVEGVVVNIIKAVIGITALVAVVFIIVGGVQYMTSTGEAAKVEKAKKTILYAVIGLAICVLAFAIVNWTVGAINGKSGEKQPASSYKDQGSCQHSGYTWNAKTGKCH